MTDARTRLLAYCGDPAAREADDLLTKRFGEMRSTDQWIAGLVPLVEAAAVRWEPTSKPCASCDRQICPCKDKIPDPHALLRVCLAVAWEVQSTYLGLHSGPDCDCPGCTVRRVLDACQAYLNDPSDKTLPDTGDPRHARIMIAKDRWWSELAPICHGHLVPLLAQCALTSAAKILGPERLRAVVLKAV